MSHGLEKLESFRSSIRTEMQKHKVLQKRISLNVKKQRERLEKFFGGLRGLSTLPDLVVIVGQPHEKNAVSRMQEIRYSNNYIT